MAGLHIGEKGMQFLHQFHHVFWLGDLNYRVCNPTDGSHGTMEEFKRTQECIARRQLWKLRVDDQLLNELKKGRIFCGFKVSEG